MTTGVLLRWAVIGASVGAVVGCVVGLVVGLHVHAATAWFATFEIGIPAAVVGGCLGLLVDGVRALARGGR